VDAFFAPFTMLLSLTFRKNEDEKKEIAEHVNRMLFEECEEGVFVFEKEDLPYVMCDAILWVKSDGFTHYEKKVEKKEGKCLFYDPKSDEWHWATASVGNTWGWNAIRSNARKTIPIVQAEIDANVV